jgi:tRNA modification GTPase
MFCPDDTIVAVATPPGRGGIGVVRISGPAAPAIATQLSGHPELEPRRATLARVGGPAGAIDRVLLTLFPAPHSYTGEDVVEVSAHGSQVLLRGIVQAAMDAGARLAEPGEFTLRAFLRGRIDLIQAEAVRDLVDAVTPLQARAAFDQLEGTLTVRIGDADRALFDLVARLEASLDFPDEGYHFVEDVSAAREIHAIARQLDALRADAVRGRLIREGVQVVFAGRPNAGKSSLFNRLAGAGRAIVTELPGTTRDLLTETVEIDGVPVTLVDTAGLRETAGDAIEAEGIARAIAARAVAAVVLVVLDQSVPISRDDRLLLEHTAAQPRVIAATKSDLPAAWTPEAASIDSPVLRVSAVTGEGLETLRAALLAIVAGSEPLRDAPAITNVRHADLISQARDALERAAAAAAAGTPEEFVLADLNEARTRLEEVTGARTPDDVIHEIFGRFCIGK